VPQSIAAAAAACQETGRCSLPVTGCYHFENLLGPGKKLLVRVPEIYCWLSILVQSAFPLVAYPTSPKSFLLLTPSSPFHPQIFHLAGGRFFFPSSSSPSSSTLHRSILDGFRQRRSMRIRDLYIVSLVRKPQPALTGCSNP
jgi:hypothetical protein